MSKAIFEYRDYKAYLRDRVRERGRGEKSRFAATLRCHLAYVSQTLGGNAQFSLEQADALNQHLGHSEHESDFFLLLVSQARAGTPSLRKLYEGKIQKYIHEQTLLANRLKAAKAVPVESQATYYSTWYYSAIHLLVTIPAFQTKEEIARHLRIPTAKITQALEFLISTGLVEYSKGRYRTGQGSLYLAHDSPWAARQHSTWRMQAIHAVERPDPKNLHYTSVVSMSEDDAPKIRKILVDAIEEVRAVVRASPEKGLYCYTLDFFGV